MGERPDTHCSRSWTTPVVVFVIAFALRLSNALILLRKDPFTVNWDPGFDMAHYRDWALAIARGDWGSRLWPVFHYNVLFPYVLGAWIRVVGDFPWLYAILNSILSSFACACTASVAQRVASRRVGFAAGLLLAAAAPSMYLDAFCLPESLTLATAAAGMWAFLAAWERPHRKSPWIALGVATGLMALARGNGLIAAATAAVILGVRECRREALRHGMRGPVLWAAAAGCMILPATIHNAAFGGRLVPITSNVPAILLIGNAADSSGLFDTTPTYRAMARWGEVPDLPAAPVLRVILRSWAMDPVATVFLFLRKIPLLLADAEWPDNVSFALGRRWSPLTSWNPVTFAPLLSLALASMVVLPLRGCVGALWIWVFGVALSIWCFYVVGKYRLLAYPALCVLASAGAFGLGGQSLPRAARWACVLLVSWALSTVAMPRVASVLLLPSSRSYLGGAWPTPVRELDWNNVAGALARFGRLEEAREIAVEGLRMHPRGELLQRTHAHIAMRQGRSEEAASIMRSLLRVRPNDPVLLFRLALAEWASGHWAEAEQAMINARANRPPEDMPIAEMLREIRARRPPPSHL